MANISDYFGGGSSGVVEAEGTASGAVTLGDPVSLSGGVVKKISGVNAQFNASSPAYAYLHNSNTAFQYHYQVIVRACLLYTSPSPRDLSTSRMPSSA